MLPIVAFTGYSDNGKTTVVCGVISELTKKGYTVASIKHDGHGHPLQTKEGSNSDRHKKSGAVCSITSNKNGYELYCDSVRDASPQELASLMPATTDIIICEGFKKADVPKIEVFRAEAKTERANKGDGNLIAVATDVSVEDDLPILDINDHKAIADFVEAQFLKDRPDIALYLIVDGKPVPTKDFLLKMLTYSIHGLIKPLKGCDNPKEIIIKAVYD